MRSNTTKGLRSGSSWPSDPGQTWAEWRTSIWKSMEARFGYPGFAPLEQYMLRSQAEERCVECGERGALLRYDRPTIVPSVDHYFLCHECDEDCARRIGGEIRPGLVAAMEEAGTW